MKDKRLTITILIWLVVSFLGLRMSNCQTFAKTYGGTNDDHIYSIQQTMDGGYIVAGGTNSFGSGGWDVWVLKLDASGEIIWEKTYGGASGEIAYLIQQTMDGGYIIAGQTWSFDAGWGDIWVLKINASGDVIWQKSYGGEDYDISYSIKQTSDGGYIVVGGTWSFGAAWINIWVLKLDASGNVIWQKSYSADDMNYAYSIQQTTDGGYIIAGELDSFGENNPDFLIIKLDASGNVIWKKTYGGANVDWSNSIQQTADGGYIVSGGTASFSAAVNIWILKLDASGNIQWQRTYGGANDDWASSIQQTADGGYIVAGETYSFGAGSYDFWLIKLDPNGNIGSACNIIRNTSILPSSAYYISIDTLINPSDTLITAVSSNATIQNSSSLISTQCLALVNLQAYMKAHVDDTGSPAENGIIEPDELITLRGHLENIGYTDATNTIGLLSGPESINIPDPNASYGTIPAGANQICTDCYTGVNAPSANRTSTHWDITVTENVSSDGYGPVPFDYIYHIGASFTDVPPSNIFYIPIETVLHAGVAGGCTSNSYCPSATVRRDTMAKFICNSMQASAPGSCTLSGSCAGVFADVPPSNPFCQHIEALNAAGVVGGCGGGNYCPTSNTVRQQMAKFVCAGMETSNPGSCVVGSCTGIFGDVPASNPFCPYIEKLYELNVVSGCQSTPLLYCPSSTVLRDQMAKFIVKGFGFSL